MDVCVLRWPDQADEADRLASLGAPRLLFVEPGAPPPTETSCVVDWLRLPADDEDMRVRLAVLSERAARHPSGPVVNDYGQLSHRGTTVFLSSIDERVTKILIENLGHPVPAEVLVSRAWTEDATNETLRVHISRLRHHIAPLGLTITNIRGHGYVMHPAESADSPPQSPARCRLGLRAISRLIDLIFNVGQIDGLQSGDGERLRLTALPRTAEQRTLVWYSSDSASLASFCAAATQFRVTRYRSPTAARNSDSAATS